MMRFLPTWKDAANKVVQHVRNGKNVLVTCLAGQNRSGLVTALALQQLTGWSGKKIVNHISAKRMWALHNATFAQYIIDTFPETGDEVDD
jgi:protein-tyrosine phosphatase